MREPDGNRSWCSRLSLAGRVKSKMASSYLPSLFLAILRLYNAIATECMVSRPLLMSAVQARTARSGSWTLAQLARGSSQPATAQHMGSKLNTVRLPIYCRLHECSCSIIKDSGTARYGLPWLLLQATNDPRQPFFVGPCLGRHGAAYATASIASGVSLIVVRRNSRRSLRSKRRPRWTVARLSHMTRSPTCHLCA